MRIEMDRLNMTYPTGKQALREVSLCLESPSLIGLVGPNGAGKSTLMKLLTAGLLASGGGVTVDGVPLQSCERDLKARLGYLPQDFGLYDELTVRQFLDYMSALKNVPDKRAAIAQALAATGLEAQDKARIRTLSGGQRQRVGIAQAQLGKPEFLIFDEPTVGLDPEERIRFRNLFSQTAQDKLVVLSTHIIEDVQSVCDHLVVLNRGRVLFAGRPEELICRARGHVGTFLERPGGETPPGLRVVSRVNTAAGVACRAVGEVLPEPVQPVEPVLEDAYLYFITREEAAR